MSTKRRGRSGFTLIELLVVIAIIGLLATLAVVALNSARVGARDAKRLADVRQIATALELYNDNHGGYPTQTSIAELGVELRCLGSGGFSATLNCPNPYMAVIPAGPGNPGSGYYYTSLSDTEYYVIRFFLEGKSGGFGPGNHYLTPEGIFDSPPS
jgi:prepilin-type N-terminal cleavage/methylation domain-containing protein